MKNATYVQLATVRLKPGVDEATLLATSDAFQREFVHHQPGIIRRVVLRARDGGYADLVFFEDKAAADRVAAAEATSSACHAFFAIFEPPDPALPDMGVLSFEHVKTYE